MNGFFSVRLAVAMLALAASFSQAAAPAKPAKPAKPAPPPIVFEKAPAAVLDPASWLVTEVKGNGFTVGESGGKPIISASGKTLQIVSPAKLDVNTRVRAQFRFTKPTGSVSLALGLADAVDVKEKGKLISVTSGPAALGWSVFDPNSKARLPTTNGQYRPQFVVERSLAWPEALRANVEADIAASKPLVDRRFTLDVVLRDRGYEVSLDGIPLTTVASDTSDPRGFARITLSPSVELTKVETSAAPLDASWVFQAVPLDSVVNAAKIDGRSLERAGTELQHDNVPFQLAGPNADGNDHVDLGLSWFRAGNVSGRYSGRGTDAVSSRWPGALIQDPARITVRLPMARYRALHLLAAADSDADEVPVVTAQFYRAQAGFPKNFDARVPAFTASSASADAVAVKTTDGKGAKLYHVTIPINPSSLAEFEDLDFVDVELTKEVQIYRASPDPMYYSQHAAGLPSSVHVFAMTAERPAVDVKLTAEAYAHIWTAPEKPTYTVSLKNRRGKARPIQLRFTTQNGLRSTEQEETIVLRPDKEAFTTFTFQPAVYGLHNVRLTITDGEQSWTEVRDLAYLHEDTRERGDWDFGRGPLFGFWNWGWDPLESTCRHASLSIL